MKTIIAGSRDNVTLDNVRQAMLDAPFEITEVVSGTARGADRFGEVVAREYGLPVHKFPADWENLDAVPCKIKRNQQGRLYNALAGHNRNREMSIEGEALVAIWDGKSFGTKNMIDTMKRLNKPVSVFIVQKEK